MAEPQPFPWREAMQFGFGILKLSSSEFWNLTILELHAAMRAHGMGREEVVARDWLENAMQQFPDEPNKDH